MSFRSLLTHVVNDRGCNARLRMTASVARALGAAVIGLGALATFGDSPIELECAQADFEAARRRFREQLGDLATVPAWREAVAPPSDAILMHARAADIIVSYRTSWRSDPSRYAASGALVMESGLPVLLLPHREAEFRPETILLAWKNTRETRQAISNALPLLQSARRVLVVAVCGAREIETIEQELADVESRLVRQSVKATTLAEVGAPGSAGRKLLRIAETDRSDLIVAGGYGHSRLREWALGGVTRDLIADGRRYVLLVH